MPTATSLGFLRNHRTERPTGVCVFDIDLTLTCEGACDARRRGAMAEAIDWCRGQGMDVAINTARPPQDDVLWGIPLEVRARVEGVPVYVRPHDGPAVEVQKHLNMERIATRFGVPVERTVLIDDRRETCEYLRTQGVPCVHVATRDGVTPATLGTLQEVVARL